MRKEIFLRPLLLGGIGRAGNRWGKFQKEIGSGSLKTLEE